ncbi:TIGR02281 family clan AA aspartic protease [Erythrobacter sp. SCSIO 43205]|uniref:retropepsin-like aspartic protease family protein n=1 Tax=Erythrobacter sp. SCSIO 43205 TaxID=2779361 RepID=UPI001CA818DA|nr:TIGR02281 family clan AA aspartic protease [Erythrobacter sp. SCSIO 43205]UAB78149.1 TIGR02281 family clan AA aspartic protease [Erythrobacter sp. SCSIO 43205]
MIGRTLALAAGVCLFAALVAEGSKSGEPSTGESWVPRQEAVAANIAHNTAQAGGQSANSDWYSGSHTLKRAYDGHFYAEANVNGRSMRMMVDTGASVIALTGADARAAGISWSLNEVRPIGRGASGDVYGVVRTLEEVEIGGFTKHNVRAIVVPEGLDVSLLGQSFLGEIASVEIQGDQMRLSGG